MKNISKNPGIYIHIPFCDTKCGYCDFYSVTGNSQRSKFLPSLIAEINHFKTEPFTSAVFDTIYLGGGTPSLLTESEMEKIFESIYNNFKISDGCEITVEVNPGTVDERKLTYYKSLGINRLSIGIQSFNDNELKMLGRIHDSDQAIKTFNRARNSGFDNISIDLIYALPDQTIATWQHTMNTGLSLQPDHISAYNLIYEKGTPFYNQLMHGRLSQKSEEEEIKFYKKTISTFEQKGYIHYEVSSYSQGEAKFSRHNYKYWNHTNYLSFGPSAHSYWNKKRWSNIRSLHKYITNISENQTVIDFSENLEMETLIFEKIMLSLRTNDGINLEDFETTFNSSFITMHNNLNSELIENGFAIMDKGSFKLTQKGMMICDEILSRFAPN
jgi:oxygen-independent coproporphyrinogen-3 oxidase